MPRRERHDDLSGHGLGNCRSHRPRTAGRSLPGAGSGTEVPVCGSGRNVRNQLSFKLVDFVLEHEFPLL